MPELPTKAQGSWIARHPEAETILQELEDKIAEAVREACRKLDEVGAGDD